MDSLQGVVRELAAVIGKDKVSTVPEDLALYSYDCSTYSKKPDVVVRVERKEDVVYILDVAERYGVPVVPRGNATNNCGAVIPVDGGIVLDFVGMNRIIEIDTENFIVVCEPGVITAELQARVEEVGLFYPPDPSGLNMSTIGGNVALNAGGPRAVKYGVTRDYVLGLEAVLPGGHILRTGGKYVKDSSGYNLTQLLVGSEGTLGVFTEIILQLVPLPETRKTILCAYDLVEEAASTVVEILKKRIVPSAMEFLDRVSVELIQHYMDAGYPTDAEGVLLIELDGSAAEVERQIKEVADVARTCGARETRIACTADEEQAIWAGRRAGFAALAAYKPVVIPEDATVPRSYLPEMIRKIQAISQKYGMLLPIFGHAGDGNVHPHICFDPSNQEEVSKVAKIKEDIYKTALDLGGTLTGEHGIGLTKKHLFPLQHGEKAIELMQGIKKVFDPHNILNPSKIF